MSIHSNFTDIRFLDSDVELFWEIFSKAAKNYQATHFEQNYFLAGSVYLHGFFKRKIKKASILCDILNSPEGYAYYRSIEKNTKNIDQQYEAIFDAFQNFKALYPSSKFCDVAFVIGAFSSGGIIHQDTIVIGLELFSKTADSKTDSFHPWVQNISRELDYLPSIIIHELVHVQQAYFLQHSKHQVQLKRLLDISLMEGTADFVCALIFNNKFPNDSLHLLADKKEKQFWQQFKQDMLQEDYGNWLYKQLPDKNALSNLGYYMGFKIVESYYNKQGATPKALQEIIELKDPIAFLEASGYEDKFL